MPGWRDCIPLPRPSSSTPAPAAGAALPGWPASGLAWSRSNRLPLCGPRPCADIPACHPLGGWSVPRPANHPAAGPGVRPHPAQRRMATRPAGRSRPRLAQAAQPAPPWRRPAGWAGATARPADRRAICRVSRRPDRPHASGPHDAPERRPGVADGAAARPGDARRGGDRRSLPGRFRRPGGAPHAVAGIGRFAAWVEPALVAKSGRLNRGYAASWNGTLGRRSCRRHGLARTLAQRRPARRARLAADRGWPGPALRMERPAPRCPQPGHRSLPALVGLAVRWPLERAAGASRGEPAREAGPPAGRRAAQGSRGSDPAMVARGLPTEAGPILPCRFADEAWASMPGLAGSPAAPSPDEVLAAPQAHQLSLPHGQQAPEWTLPTPGEQGPCHGTWRDRRRDS